MRVHCFPARCYCGRRYSFHDFETLQFAGQFVSASDHALTARRCMCGTVMSAFDVIVGAYSLAGELDEPGLFECACSHLKELAAECARVGHALQSDEHRALAGAFLDAFGSFDQLALGVPELVELIDARLATETSVLLCERMVITREVLELFAGVVETVDASALIERDEQVAQ